MTVEYSIPAEGVIPYKYFVVPTNFTEDKYVQFAEIRSGDRAHVHHVIISVALSRLRRVAGGGRADSRISPPIRSRRATPPDKERAASKILMADWLAGHLAKRR